MGSSSTPQADTALENLLARSSPLTREYAQMVRAEPPPELDARILAAARSAAPAAAVAGPARAASPPANAPASRPTAAVARPAAVRRPAPVADDDDDDDDDDDPRQSAKPRWLIPAFLAAAVLLASGIGIRVFTGGAGDDAADRAAASPDDAAAGVVRRARERREAARAAAGSDESNGDRDAAVVELDAERAADRPVLPPPPIFAPEAPQVDDLDAAIALIRKALVAANQAAAARADGPPAALAGGQAEAPASAVVIQPRERRLAKVLELYDSGHPELAADALEIYLRDFADDPVAQQILAPKR